MKRIISSSLAPRAIGPYSQAIEANGLVFVSGQIPIDSKSGIVSSGDIQSQAVLILENAKAILSAAGCELRHVVKTTIYLRNMDDFTKVNDIYGTYFPTDPPARSTVEVSRLPRDVTLEMDFIACKA